MSSTIDDNANRAPPAFMALLSINLQFDDFVKFENLERLSAPPPYVLEILV
jgi:hypothetical protein